MKQQRLNNLLLRELEQKQRELFEHGHQGRKTGRRYLQLIDAQDILRRATPRRKKSHAHRT